MSGAGSIAERTPGQNKEIRIDTFIHINADGNTDTVKDKDTDDKDKNECKILGTNMDSNRKLQTCDSGSMRAMLNCGSKLKDTVVRKTRK